MPSGKPVAVPIPVAPGVGKPIQKFTPTVKTGMLGNSAGVLSVQGVTGVTVTVGVDPPAALSATMVKI